MDPKRKKTRKVGSTDATSNHEDFRQWYLSDGLREMGGYLVGPEIGRGGMGVVYRAYDRDLGREVAMKLLPPPTSRSSTSKKRFQIEAKAAGMLNHDHIVPVYNVGEQEDIHFFTMKLIDGTNLMDVVDSARTARRSGETTVKESTASKTSSASWSEIANRAVQGSTPSSSKRDVQGLVTSVANLGMQVADALGHAHANGIVHRDIKPSNLLLGENQKVWVSDFGLAHLQDSPSITRTGDLLGTLQYMSPEQASGRRSFVDHRTDIYSLGATLYELAVLQPMCRGKTSKELLRELTLSRPLPIRRINPRIPVDFETILCKATERNPADRYASAELLAEDLRKFVRGERVRTKRVPVFKRAADWLLARPVASLTAFGATLGLIAALSFMLLAVLKSKAQVAAALRESTSQRMISDMARKTDEDPGTAIAIGTSAPEISQSFEGRSLLMAAVGENHELKTIDLGDDFPGQIVLDEARERVLICPHPKYFRVADSLTFYSAERGAIATLSDTGPVTSAGFSRNGDYLLTAGCSYGHVLERGEQTLYSMPTLWNATTLKRMKTFPNSQSVRCGVYSFSSDSRFVVLPREEQAAVYSLENLDEPPVVLSGHEGRVLHCGFSPDAKTIATFDSLGVVRTFDVASGDAIREESIDAGSKEGVVIQFSPNSQWLMASGDRGTLLIDPTDKTVANRFRAESKSCFVGGQHHLAVLSESMRRISLYDPQLNSLITECETPEYVREIGGAGDTFKVTGWNNERAWVFDLENGEVTSEFKGHSDWIVDFEVNHKPGEFVTVGWDGTLRFWNEESDLDARTYETRFAVGNPPVLGYSQFGKLAVVGTVVRRVTRILNFEEKQEEASVLEEFATQMSEDAFVTTDGGVVTIRENPSGQRLNSVKVGERVSEVIPVGGLLLVSTSGGGLYSWDMRAPYATRINEKGQSYAIARTGVQDDSVLIASGERLLIYTPTTGGQEEVSNQLTSRVLSLALTPDASLACVATLDRKVAFYNTQDRSQVSSFSSSIAAIGAYFLDEGKVLLHEGVLGNKVEVWSIQNGEMIAQHEVGRILDVDLREDRSECIMATSTGTFRWNLREVAEVEPELILETPSTSVEYAGDQIWVATNGMVGPKPGQRLTGSTLCGIDPVTNEVENRLELGQRVETLHVDAATKSVFVSYFAQGVDVIEADSLRRLQTIAEHDRNLILAGFVDSDQQIVTVSRGGRILLNDRNSADSRSVGDHDSPITCAALSDDRTSLIVADSSGRICQWNMNTLALDNEFENGNSPVSQMALFAGKLLVTRHGTERLVVWNWEGGLPRIQQEFEFEEGVQDFAYSGSQKRILAICGEGTKIVPTSNRFNRLKENPPELPDALLIDVESGQKRPILFERDAVEARFYDSGRIFVVLTTEGDVHLFDTATCLEREPRTDRRESILGLALSSEDGLTMITADRSTIHGWNVRTGEQTLEVLNASDPALARLSLPSWLPASGRGGDLLLPTKAGLIFVPRDVVEYAKQRAPRTLSSEEREKYFLAP